MASFKPTIITKKGHTLMAKIVAGKATPKFTKISVSDHEYSSSTNFESVTNLSSIKQTTLVSSVSKINSAAVKVSGALSNAELSTGYYLRTIGLYASDPSEGEILYSITTATKPDWIPPNNGVSASSIMIDLITVVSNASNVSIDVDPNATATVAQINELKDEMDKSKTVPFSTSGKSVTSYPVGTKGLFNPVVKGSLTMNNLVPLFFKDTNNDGLADGLFLVYNAKYKNVNGVQKFTATVKYGGFAVKFKYESGHKYYFSSTIKADSNLVGLEINKVRRKSHSGNGKIEKISYIYESRIDIDHNFGIYDYRPSDWTETIVYGWCAYDVTNDPRSNEEIKAYYDNIGYIDGTATSALSYEFVSRGENILNNNIDDWESGTINTDTGKMQPSGSRLRTKHFIPISSDVILNKKSYNLSQGMLSSTLFYDANKNYLSRTMADAFIVPKGAKYLKQLFHRDPNNVKINDIKDVPISITEGSIPPCQYISYGQTKTEFSVPRPLINVGNSMDKISDKGDLCYMNNYIVLDGSEQWIQGTISNNYLSAYSTINGMKRNTKILSNKFVYNDDYSAIYEAKREGIIARETIGGVIISISLTNLDSPDITGFKAWLNENKTVVYYQLTEPEIIHNGEQGYQAPSPLPAYQNGDLVLLPKHHKKYQVNSTTTLTLAEEISDLDYARTEIDGKVIDLDCTLESDGKTVTIPETTGWVDIKGTIPSKNCLNPEICADMPANLGTITSANTTSIANLQQKYDKHENIQDLINLEMDYRLTILENK